MMKPLDNSGAPRAHRVRALVAVVALLCVGAGLGGCGGPDATKARHMAKGEELLAERNFEQARVEFLNVLKIDPNDAAARYGAGQAFEASGVLRQALGHYMSAVEADPAHLDARIAFARLLVLGKDGERARSHVDEILRMSPENAAGLGLQASILALSGDQQGAEQFARRSVAAAPSNEIGLPLLASLLMGQKQSEEALELVSAGIASAPDSVGLRSVKAQMLESLGRGAEQQAELRALMDLEPDVSAHVVALAAALVRAGDRERALELLREKSAPADAPLQIQSAYLQLAELVAPERVEAEYARSIAASAHAGELELQYAAYLLRNERADAAEAQLRRTAGSSVSRVALEAQTGLAQYLIDRGRVDEAGAIVEQVRKQSPTNQAALVIGSLIALSRQDYEDAVADLRLAIRDAPEAPLLRRLLAQAYRASGRDDMARQEFAAALELAPDDAVALAQLTVLELSLGNYGAALELSIHMSRLPGVSLQGLEHQYRALLGLQRLDEALAVARLLDEASPRSGVGPFLTGVVQQSRGELAEAEASYRRALDRQPGAVEPLSTLVRMQIADGRTEEARELLAAQREKDAASLMIVKFQGDLEASAGNLAKARELYEYCLAREPALVAAHRGLIGLAHLSDDWLGAEQAYARALEATGQRGLHLEYALHLQARERARDAIGVYRDALSSFPGDETFSNNLAMLIADNAESRAELDAALELVRRFELGRNPAHLSTLGWLQYQRGEMEPALRLLRRSVALDGESPQVRYQLAEVLAKAGEHDDARRELDLALAGDARFPGHEEARALRASL